MKKAVVVFAVFALCAFMIPDFSTAQDVNFSGTWVLDKEKTPTPEPRGNNQGERGGRGGRGGMRGPVDTFDISHKGNSFVMSYTREGRNGAQEVKTEIEIGGKAVETENRRGTTSTKGYWAKDKKTLVVEIVREMDMRGEVMTMESSEKYLLSDGGKVLTRITGRQSRNGDLRETKAVYNKK